MTLFTPKVALVTAALFVPAGLGFAVSHLAGTPRADASAVAEATIAAPVEAPPRSPFAVIPEPPNTDEQAFSGVVREVRPAGSYVYLAVETASGASRWVATHAKATVPEGSEVDVRSFAARTDFESPRLGRTFDRLLFGIVTRRNVL